MLEHKGSPGRIRLAPEHLLTAPPDPVLPGRRASARSRPVTQGDAGARHAARVRSGGTGSWESLPIPAQPQVKDPDVKSLVRWILGGVN